MPGHIAFKVLSKHVDGMLAAEEAGLVQKHLSECKACRETFFSLKMSVGLLKKLPRIAESEHFDFEFNRRLEEALTKRTAPEIYYSRIRETIERFKPGMARPVPVLVRSIALITVVAFLMVSVVWNEMGVVPAVASVTGDARIFNSRTGIWQAAKAGMRVGDKDQIRIGPAGRMTIQSQKYDVVLKENTSARALAIEKMFRGKGAISYGLDSGAMLVAARDEFGGSGFTVESPQARIKAKGTRFLVKVSPAKAQKTWAGVLDGTIEVASKTTAEGPETKVLVDAGKATEVEQGSAPRIPAYQNESEWDQIKELYGLGDQPLVALIISMTPRRVDELLRPVALYISDKKTKAMPNEVIRIADKINQAIADNDKEEHSAAISDLERLVKEFPDKRYNIQFQFFIAAYYYYLDEYKKAISILDNIIVNYPDSYLTSLAVAAKGVIYEKGLKDEKGALGVYETILAKYPKSLEAEMAAEGINRLRAE